MGTACGSEGRLGGDRLGFSAGKALETLRLSEVMAGKSVGGPEVVPGLNPRKLQHPGAMRSTQQGG